MTGRGGIYEGPNGPLHGDGQPVGQSPSETKAEHSCDDPSHCHNAACRGSGGCQNPHLRLLEGIGLDYHAKGRLEGWWDKGGIRVPDPAIELIRKLAADIAGLHEAYRIKIENERSIQTALHQRQTRIENEARAAKSRAAASVRVALNELESQ